MRITIILIFVLSIFSCATQNLSKKEIEIKTEFTNYLGYKISSNSKIKINITGAPESITEIIKSSPEAIPLKEIVGYRPTQYIIEHRINSGISFYRVIEFCKFSQCKYKYIYVTGVYF